VFTFLLGARVSCPRRRDEGGALSLLSRVEFLGEMSDVLHSRAPLPLIPPTPFSPCGRRGSLGVLMAETGDGTQGLAKKSTPVSALAPGRMCHCRCEMEIENLIRYTERAVGLMEIEHLIRYTALAVGLKPSAMQGKAHLPGQERNNFSKSIRPRPGEAKPACAGESGILPQSPYALGYARQSPPARARAE